MWVSFLTVFAMSVAPLTQVRSTADIERPVAMTVHLGAVTVRLGSEDTVSFRVSHHVVTDIDLDVSSADYSVPLQCAGGLHDVEFGTVELSRETADSFALLFDMGKEQDRKFGTLPRVQVGFSRGRLAELNVTTMTSERSGFTAKLCSSLPGGPIIRDTRPLQDQVMVATLGQTRWRLPVTIETVQDVSTRSAETGGGQAEVVDRFDRNAALQDRAFQRSRLVAGIARRFAGFGQRLAVRLRDVLSRDSAIRPGSRFPLPARARSCHITEPSHD